MTVGSKVVIDYTNWKGVRRERVVEPVSIVFSHSPWHPETQWLLEAIDAEDGVAKHFAMRDIHSWRPAT